MSILQDPDANFINALSGFWVTFFEDADGLRDYFEGVQLNLGQVYLEMLQTVLGTSLKDMPLFHPYYFKYMEVRKDRLFFSEGASLDLDAYVFTQDGANLAQIGSITNRVVAPTAYLNNIRDYAVKDGSVYFTSNIFDTDGNGTYLPLFPVRSATFVEAATYTDPLGTDWVAAGVKVGDWFRLRFAGAQPVLSRVTGIDGATLFLDTALAQYKQDFSRRTMRVGVVRTPYNQQITGEALSANTRAAVRMSSQTTDAAYTPAASTLDFTGEAYFKGTWTPATSYAEGDLVNVGTYQLYRAKSAHISGLTFDSTAWDILAANFLYVTDPENPENSGLCQVLGATGYGVLSLLKQVNFVATASNRCQLVFGSYVGSYVVNYKPVLTLHETFLLKSTVTVQAKRAHDVTLQDSAGNVTLYPAGAAVVENVDYAIDYEAGTLTICSIWDPTTPSRVDLSWQRSMVNVDYRDRGAWVAFTAYTPGNLVSYNGQAYLCISADPGSVAFDLTYYKLYVQPFAFDVTNTVPVMGMWGVHVQVDEDRLYNNFGYLLDYQKPTSEQYRAFLRGVAQLFLIGPTLERFESAMNVMAGFPVVRDDGELLRSFSNGVDVTGSDGALIDSAQGRNGVLNAATSTFTALSDVFFPSDIGARLRVRNGAVFDEYVVTGFINATKVVIAPTPPDNTAAVWTFSHVALTTRFRISSGLYLFAPDDVGGTITISGSSFPRNNGTFHIVAVENVTTVILDAPFGFDDEQSLSWSLSRNNVQVVTTSRAEYAFPLNLAMRADVMDSANYNVLSFRAFESLTEAFRVTDYVRDPTWWHDITIPTEVLQLQVDEAARRKVSPTLIEHNYNALDVPVYGDVGLAYGVDDEGQPGTARAGTVWWYGGDTVVLAFDAGVPTATSNDVGQHLVVREGPAKGFYKITAVQPDGLVLSLERFPSRQLNALIPPISFSAELPPLLFRRTVAFVMMDRFLKYHAVYISIDKNTPLPSDFIVDVTQLVAEASPAHTHIYLTSQTNFKDTLSLTEDFVLGYGPYIPEALWRVPNNLTYGPPGLVRYGDAFRFEDYTTTISWTPGTYSLPVTLPVGDSQASCVKLRFDSAVLVDGATRRPAEGVDYTIDYTNLTITILPTSSFPVGPNTVYYVSCTRRYRSGTDPLDPGETNLAYGSSDPTVYRAPSQGSTEMGLVDRAVQITLGP